MPGTITSEVWYRAVCQRCGNTEDHREETLKVGGLPEFQAWIQSMGWRITENDEWHCSGCAKYEGAENA